MVYLITQLDKKPTSCQECPYSAKLQKFEYKELFCTAEHRSCEGGNPIWCPLVEFKQFDFSNIV